MIKNVLTIFTEFWFTMSAVSYFTSCSSFRRTEHIKEARQIFYTSPRRSRYVCGATHSALPRFHEKDEKVVFLWLSG